MPPFFTAKIKFTRWDVGILVALLVGLIYLGYCIQFGLHYRWNWQTIPQYLLFYDKTTGALKLNFILLGFFTTLKLSFWTILLASLIGFAMALARMSQFLYLRLLAGAYVGVIRNIPPLVLVFIFYYFISDQLMLALAVDERVAGLPAWLKPWFILFFSDPEQFPVFCSAVITLSVYEGAYVTEIIRAGIQSIDKGQWEAVYALGLKRSQQYRWVILPQAGARILPPLAGQFISVIKDSAIVSVISVQDLTFQGMELMASTYLTFEVWFTITGLYFLLTFGCSFCISRLEKHLRASRFAAVI